MNYYYIITHLYSLFESSISKSSHNNNFDQDIKKTVDGINESHDTMSESPMRTDGLQGEDLGGGDQTRAFSGSLWPLTLSSISPSLFSRVCVSACMGVCVVCECVCACVYVCVCVHVWVCFEQQRD